MARTRKALASKFKWWYEGSEPSRSKTVEQAWDKRLMNWISGSDGWKARRMPRKRLTGMRQYRAQAKPSKASESQRSASHKVSRRG